LLGTGFFSSLLIAAYGLVSYLVVRVPRGAAPILTVARYRNELRQIAFLRELVGEQQIAQATISKGSLLNPLNLWVLLSALVRRRGLVTYWRAVCEYNRGDFLVACRVASTAAYFLRFNRLLCRAAARATLVTSDSNPYAMGLSYASRCHGMRTIYVTHGHIPDGPPALDFDLAILDGQAVLDVYRATADEAATIVFKGAEGECRPMDCGGLAKRDGLCVGIFASLIVDWSRFSRTLAIIQETLKPARIVFRLHPNQLIRDPAAYTAARSWDNLDLSDGSELLLADAAQCDLVLAAGSSCHLSVLKYGVPTASVAGLDAVPHDFYHFIERKIVPHFEEPNSLSLESLRAFYEDNGWVGRFQAFDAAYPNRSQDCRHQVSRAIQKLIA
jgi:hypothetical protein